jgi:hypothetical protein
MAETVDEISINYEDGGELIVEELDKIVLTKRGPWTTILFRYRELDKKTGQFGGPKATIRRFQKHQGIYKKRDTVNLTAESSQVLIPILQQWLKDELIS